MIETVQFRPPRRRVAGGATRCRTVWSFRLHSFLKFPFMRIDVASDAGEIVEMVFQRLLCPRHEGLVAIRTQHRRMSAREWKSRFLVTRQREVRR